MSDEKRPYRKKARAEQEEQTRLRITESTVELHGTVGPAHTSISAVAERAGVRRSTVYRHFPDEAALFAACTEHWNAANPPPQLESWAAIEDSQNRLRYALEQLYGYYRRSEAMLYNLHRDEDAMPIVKQLFGGFRSYLVAAQSMLMTEEWSEGHASELVHAAIGHALAFPTWRSLAREQGLDDAQGADLMCRLVAAAASEPD